MTDLTCEQLRELLHYDPMTGRFTRRVSLGGGSQVGDEAGCLVTSTGYRMVRVKARQYREHRLAWFYMHGVWPSQEIDHINGRRDDNRIANLRDVPRSINSQNVHAPKGAARSILLGVSVSPSKSRPWKASIRCGGKSRHIGLFVSQEEAHAAYLTVKRALHAGCTI